jgi:hypothetical protein
VKIFSPGAGARVVSVVHIPEEDNGENGDNGSESD